MKKSHRPKRYKQYEPDETPRTTKQYRKKKLETLKEVQEQLETISMDIGQKEDIEQNQLEENSLESEQFLQILLEQQLLENINVFETMHSKCPQIFPNMKQFMENQRLSKNSNQLENNTTIKRVIISK